MYQSSKAVLWNIYLHILCQVNNYRQAARQTNYYSSCLAKCRIFFSRAKNRRWESITVDNVSTEAWIPLIETKYNGRQSVSVPTGASLSRRRRIAASIRRFITFDGSINPARRKRAYIHTYTYVYIYIVYRFVSSRVWWPGPETAFIIVTRPCVISPVLYDRIWCFSELDQRARGARWDVAK